MFVANRKPLSCHLRGESKYKERFELGPTRPEVWSITSDTNLPSSTVKYPTHVFPGFKNGHLAAPLSPVERTTHVSSQTRTTHVSSHRSIAALYTYLFFRELLQALYRIANMTLNCSLSVRNVSTRAQI